jgi:hypothetical protein
VDGDADALPNDRYQNTSDPSFSIILTGPGNHLEDLAAGVDPRSEMLKANRHSELTLLAPFRRLLGKPPRRLLVGGNWRRTHAWYRYARKTDSLASRRRDAIIPAQRGNKVPLECSKHRVDDFADNEIELVHRRSKGIGYEFGPFASLQHLLKDFTSLPRSVCDRKSECLSGIERVLSGSMQVQRLNERWIGKSGQK